MKPRWVYSKQLDGFRVTVYGACRDWNFAGDSAIEVERNNHGVLSAINQVMEELEVKHAFAPKPFFNAVVVPSNWAVNELFPCFYRGVKADGVMLTEPGDAYFLASADCLTAAVYDPLTHRLAGLHCGRDALVDRKRLFGGNARANESVIQACLHLFEKEHAKSIKLKIFLAAGIGADSFTHPITKVVVGDDGVARLNMNWSVNKQLIDYLTRLDMKRGSGNIVRDSVLGKISLVDLVKYELSRFGVSSKQIEWDGHDTATDKALDGTFLFHSNRRKSSWRNLVVVQLE